ncbi:prolipoprotein diacylglyceryl transferase [Mycoplasmopsis lipofaciens]|uniref:prolipoprotein diacylglyceryl transferase n=1 Tax=Mycoplasmopsis lipofaciens TaxID=114884 RepID=UPI000482755F|nr:prolipoprotein diacylglyceryl transferase [Mycoplasmopsis lipofaciens]
MNNEFAPIQANTPGILFEIGSYKLHVYSLTMMFGILASILTICIFWYREKWKWEYLMTLILLTIPFALLGARLWDLVEEYLYKRDTFDFSRWYAIWDGGLSIQGGVVLAFIVDISYIYSKRSEIDIRKVASIIIPTILIGQVIGRWGNYANHELYGKIDYDGHSVKIFGHTFAQHMFLADDAAPGGAFRYPLFLYEGLANLVGYIILVWIINQFGLLKPGSSAALYFVWYGVVRLALEPLRENAYALYTVTSVVFIVIGTLVFIYFQFLNQVHYIREWRHGRYVYEYAHSEDYNKWVEKTRIFKSRRKAN